MAVIDFYMYLVLAAWSGFMTFTPNPGLWFHFSFIWLLLKCQNIQSLFIPFLNYQKIRIYFALKFVLQAFKAFINFTWELNSGEYI